ncbi:MAG: AbrB/MazE/SpoVT family DNA-binding domain-containing protein [Vicinamibacteria bacterium]|nr:AbrB/MazE/SpoVT family DNA-binding domain-containing protein [Vicinamibacteria bacterium]
MTSTIDAAGRIVIPKALRDRLGFRPGAALELRERDGHLEIQPAPTTMSLVRRKRGVVAVPARALPALTDDLVRDTMERTRR